MVVRMLRNFTYCLESDPPVVSPPTQRVPLRFELIFNNFYVTNEYFWECDTILRLDSRKKQTGQVYVGSKYQKSLAQRLAQSRYPINGGIVLRG